MSPPIAVDDGRPGLFYLAALLVLLVVVMLLASAVLNPRHLRRRRCS